MDDPNKRMVWIDLEMTGLDLERESIIEIATIITDSELNIIAEGPNLAISVSEDLIEGMDEWNTRHHFGSGLIDRVRNCLLYTSPSPRDMRRSRMPSSA